MANGPKNPILDEIAAVKGQIAEQKAVCDDLNRALSRINESGSEAKRLEKQLPQMIQRKQEILAEIAMGTNSQEALDEINNKIAAVQQSVNDYHATAAGLQRKLDSANADLNPLRWQKRCLTEAHVRSEAEQLGAEYMELATALCRKFRRLLALVNVHGRVREHEVAIGSGQEFQSLSIPLFNLQSMEPLRDNNGVPFEQMKETIFIKNRPSMYVKEDMDAEIARLATLGVTI